MNKELTEIVFILDKSGSMHGMEADTVGGFNSVIEKQRKERGTAYVSTVLFDNSTEVLHDRIDLDSVPEMKLEDFRVGGCTALLDALGGAIHHIGMIHKYIRPEDVPAHTVFVVMTDGMENASHIYTSQKVKQMIEHEKERYGWEFIFMAANIDAVETAARYGIDARHSVNYHNDTIGSRASYEAINCAFQAIRRDGCLEDDSWRANADKDFKSR